MTVAQYPIYKSVMLELDDLGVSPFYRYELRLQTCNRFHSSDRLWDKPALSLLVYARSVKEIQKKIVHIGQV